MRKKLITAAFLIALPATIAGGWVFANYVNASNDASQQDSQEPFVCPITGEELPCEECCPLKSDP
jgi:hypothetical protein